MSDVLVRAALRALDLPPTEVERRLATADPDLRDALRREIDSLQYARLSWAADGWALPDDFLEDGPPSRDVRDALLFDRYDALGVGQEVRAWLRAPAT